MATSRAQPVLAQALQWTPSAGGPRGARDLRNLVAMAAGPGRWLGPELGLRVLIASVLHVVSGDHLRDSPRASGPGREPHLKRVEGLGFLPHCCGRNVTWPMSAFDAYLPLLGVSNGSPGFRLS